MLNPFTATGATVNRPATSVSASVALGTLPHGGASLRLCNDGPDKVFIEFGTASTVTADATTSMPLLSGAIEVLSVGPGITHMAAVTATSGKTATVYATPGNGI